jgi:ADP-heptose:LPS heptosyltransferase
VRWKDKGIQERILIRRWAAMGDVLMATPAIAALRRQKPLARIYLQTAPPFCALLKGIPILDGISDTIVWEHTHYYDLDWTYEPEDVKGTWRHPTLEYARRLGVPISGEAYHVPDTPELDAWARELLPQEAGIACGLRSTFRPKANWNAPAWRDLVAALPDSTFVLLDTERRPALDVVGGPAATPLFQMPNVVDLTGRIPSLRHLLAVLRRCKACVSVDTGLLHLAHAAGLPVVGLYGGSAAWARAPLAGGSLAIQGMAPCYPCAHTHLCTRTDGPHCLGWVTGNYVASALRRLLK